MASIGSLYELVKSGGAAVARAAASAGQSIASITATLGSRFLSASASAINALAGPSFVQANEQAFATGVQPNTTGYFTPQGSLNPMNEGEHQYAWTARFVDPQSGQQRTVKGYYGSGEQLTAAELRSLLRTELADIVESPGTHAGSAALPPDGEIDYEVRGYYTG
jgi:hypothetical protein